MTYGGEVLEGGGVWFGVFNRFVVCIAQHWYILHLITNQSLSLIQIYEGVYMWWEGGLMGLLL